MCPTPQVRLAKAADFFDGCKTEAGCKSICAPYHGVSERGKPKDFLIALASEIGRALRSDDYELRVRSVSPPQHTSTRAQHCHTSMQSK